jgi:hypothetical protein
MSYPIIYGLDYKKDFITIQDDQGTNYRVNLCTLYKGLCSIMNLTFLKMKCLITNDTVVWSETTNPDDCLTTELEWDYPVNGENFLLIDNSDKEQYIIKVKDEINFTFEKVSYKSNDTCYNVQLIRANTMAVFSPSSSVQQIEFIVCVKEINCGMG